MYGSIFNIPIFLSACFSKVPTLAAVIPFPREDKTPPVTKMYLVIVKLHRYINDAIIVKYHLKAV